MPHQLDRTLRFARYAALLVLFGLGISLYYCLVRFEAAERQAEMAREVIDEIQTARLAALRSGIWLRNYAVSPSPEALAQVRASATEGAAAVRRLVILTDGHPEQNRQASALLQEMEELLEAYRNGADFAEQNGGSALEPVLAARVRGDHTRKVRDRLEAMELVERQRFKVHNELERQHLWQVKQLLIAVGSIMTGFLLWSLARWVRGSALWTRQAGKISAVLEAKSGPPPGMLDQRQFLQQLAQLVQHVTHREAQAAVLVFDLDDFNLLNERHGRSTGDQVLSLVSERVRRQCRARDLVARLGGDEFVVALGSVASRAAASAAAERILAKLVEPIELGGDELRISVSVGIAMVPLDGQDPQSLLQVADAGLYRAKRAGKGGAAFGVLAAH